MRQGTKWKKRSLRARRSGAATLDYILVLGIILPLVAFLFEVGPKIMGLVYEMVSMLVAWPFL